MYSIAFSKSDKIVKSEPAGQERTSGADDMSNKKPPDKSRGQIRSGTTTYSADKLAIKEFNSSAIFFSGFPPEEPTRGGRSIPFLR